MTINILANSLKAALNRANESTLGTMLQALKMGDVMRTLPTHLRAKAPLGGGAAAQYPYTIQAGAGTYGLPDDAKAAFLWEAYARAGAGTLGYLIVDQGTGGDEATAPAAGHVGISPSGDIVFASADAWTNVDIQYLPQRQDVVELFLPVVAATGVCTLPTVQQGQTATYVSLLEAEALTGTTVGKKVVGLPVAAAPATTISAFNTTKLSVWFATADAVTTCRLKLGIANLVDLDTLLETASIFI